MWGGCEILIAMNGARHFKTACKWCALLLVFMALASGCHKPSTRLEPQIQFCEDIELGCLPYATPPWSDYTNECLYYEDKAGRLLEPLSPHKGDVGCSREYLVFRPVVLGVTSMRPAVFLSGHPDWSDANRARAMEKAKIAADILRQIQSKE